MRVTNIHQCSLKAPPKTVGALLDTLASQHDKLWPRHCWPHMRFDRPLAIGAQGGHGPIRYFIDAYTPGQLIRFCFTSPAGFKGYHTYEVTPIDTQMTLLQHRVKMRLQGKARLSWPLLFRPLHDALLEDSLVCAQAALGLTPQLRPWSLWVRILRCLLTRGKAQRQSMPNFYSQIGHSNNQGKP